MPSLYRCALPCNAGIGLRSPHHAKVLAGKPATGWLEVHSENFFGNGGEPLRVLDQVRSDYAVSLHGVGLSLGSTDPLSLTHLGKLKSLIDRVQPAAVSEHLCWSSVSGNFLNDLLPLPYSLKALDWVASRVDASQEFLGRPILIENISSYLVFAGAEMAEWEFLAALAQRTGCGILLDVNNVHVSASNHGFDSAAYIDALPVQYVQEIHLAGYELDENILVDTHSRPVSEEVWRLYARALERFGRTPTLIEWDNDIPALEDLLAEANKAQAMLDACEEKTYA